MGSGIEPTTIRLSAVYYAIVSNSLQTAGDVLQMRAVFSVDETYHWLMAGLFKCGTQAMCSLDAIAEWPRQV